tara:strand:+ start:5550 stop:6554 length:1005 start_codon:yes stop_codon:yes gene_type:complete
LVLKKVLVIRFSSFGDIVQASTVNQALKTRYPDVQITWLTKSAFAPLLNSDPNVGKVKKLEEFKGVYSIHKWIEKQDFDLVYDAHNSMRSNLIHLISLVRRLSSLWIKRPKSRWKRFLLFKFRINLFPKPFVGQASYLAPLLSYVPKIKPNHSSWEFDKNIADKVASLVDGNKYFVFAPSAAWEMKRWPVQHWKRLIDLFLENFPSETIVLVGGPNDQFIEELNYHDNIINLSGKLSLLESSYLVTRAELTISADTGIIHVADAHQKKGILLNGPTAFGKTFSPTIQILEAGLYCQPCSKDGRGKCERQIYQKCMVDILPDQVLEVTKGMISRA